MRDLIQQKVGAVAALVTKLEVQRLKLSNVTFVIHLMGIIDLLRHLKDLSLTFQTVNQLPWELEEFSSRFLDLMSQLADDLAAGKVDRMLPASATSRSTAPFAAFELLHQHMRDLKNLKLTLKEKDGTLLASMDLVRATALRSLPSLREAQAAESTEAEIKIALQDLSKMARKMYEVQMLRLETPMQEKLWYAKMALVLDLRKMATVRDFIPSDDRINAKKHAMKTLVEWLASRFNGAASTDNMPDHNEVFKQFLTLTGRLREAFASLPFSAQWDGVSGTVIMKSVFTMERFYKGCEDYLYLFAHCASKSMCEAVIEGCGSVWDRQARHHPAFDVGSERAVIAWSAPWPWHPEAKTFVNHAIADLFGGNLHGHFGHVNQQIGRISASATAGRSVVMDRQMRMPNRLPGEMYDVSVLGK